MALSKVGIGSLKLYYLGDRGVPDMCVWRSKYNFVESVISMVPGDRAQVTRLAQEVPLPSEPSHWPKSLTSVVVAE